MSRLGGRAALPGGDPEDVEAPPRVTPGHWVMLALGAAWRRKVIALTVFMVGLAAVTAYYRSRTPYYRVETKILAQRQQALPSVVRPAYQDLPTRSAWETVHHRENLLALIRQTKLLDNPEATSFVAREAPGTSAPQSDPLEALVLILDKRLIVETGEGTITISIDWPDPQVAYDIVQATLHNFLEARHVQEITAIDEVISILQGRAVGLRDALDAALESSRRHAARPARAPTVRLHSPSAELVRLQSLVEAKQRAIRDVEELRLQRLAELQAQLDQARNTLSDAHPTVIGLRKDLEAASRESPQIEALREDERKVRQEYASRLAREGFSGPPPTFAAQLPPSAPAPTPEDDPRVRQARIEYEQMMARVSSAQVELDAARAAFKYRYSVIWPPQRPTEPVSPSAPKIFGVGFLGCLLLALAAAVAPDLWSGRIVQRWQVVHSLDLPVLGEIRRRP